MTASDAAAATVAGVTERMGADEATFARAEDATADAVEANTAAQAANQAAMDGGYE